MTDELVFKVVENFFFSQDWNSSVSLFRNVMHNYEDDFFLAFYHFSANFFSSLNKCLVKRGLSSSQRWDRCSLILSFPDLIVFFFSREISCSCVYFVNKYLSCMICVGCQKRRNRPQILQVPGSLAWSMSLFVCVSYITIPLMTINNKCFHHLWFFCRTVIS